MRLNKIKYFSTFAFIAPLIALPIQLNTTTNQETKSENKSDSPVYYAHRGYNGRFPEETALAYEEAAKAGFNGAENDVQLTKDGIPVLFHDSVIDNKVKGGQTGRISSYTLSQLKTFDFSKGYDVGVQQILTLQEFTEQFSTKFEYFDLELKSGEKELPTKIWEVLKPLVESPNNWTIQSFNAQGLKDFAELNTDLKLAFLYGNPSDIKDNDVLNYITDLSPNYATVQLDPQFYVDTLNQYNLNSIVWTVNSKEAYDALNNTAIEYNFDTDYISDYAIFNGEFSG